MAWAVYTPWRVQGVGVKLRAWPPHVALQGGQACKAARGIVTAGVDTAVFPGGPVAAAPATAASRRPLGHPPPASFDARPAGMHRSGAAAGWL